MSGSGEQPLSISEIYDINCPYFMSIGMTYDQYWYGDTKLTKIYYQAEKYRLEQRDADAWLIGAYVGEAIGATVGNALRERGKPPIEYPKMPKLTEKRLQEEEARRDAKNREENEKLFALAWMNSFVQAGKKWEKKG